MSASATPQDPHQGADLVGTYRRFGEIGPVYEVVGVEGESLVRICLVESGREERYPAAEVRKDPLA